MKKYLGFAAVSAAFLAVVFAKNGKAATPISVEVSTSQALQSALSSLSKTAPTTISLASGTYIGPFSIGGSNAGLSIQPKAGAAVTLKCSVPVTSWTKYSGSIYQAKVASPVAQVFYQGSFLQNARYPATGFLSTVADASDKITVKAAAADLSYLNSKGIIGATLVSRIIDYWYNSNPVTAVNAATGSITVGANMNYVMAAGWGYFLANKLWMLTAPGAWVFDPANSTVYVWTPNGQAPAATDIEVSGSSGCVTATMSKNISISGVTITNSGGSAVVLNTVDGSTFQNLTVRNIRKEGFNLNSSRAFVLRNSTVDGIGGGAVTGQNYTDVGSSGNLIEGNSFSNIGTPLGPQYIAAAIFLAGEYATGTIIRRNNFTTIAYHAIYAPKGAVVTDNTVIYACTLADDCGGIYVRGSDPGVTVSGNVILLAGNAYLAGKPATRGAYPVAGIYLDDYSNHMTVSGNVVSGGTLGIMMHNAQFNTLTGNLLYNPSAAGLNAQESDVYRVWSTASRSFVVSTNASGQTYPSMKSNQLSGNFLIDRAGVPMVRFLSNQAPSSEKPVTAAIRALSLNGNGYSTLFTRAILTSSVPSGSAAIGFDALRERKVDPNATSLTPNYIPRYAAAPFAGSPLSTIGNRVLAVRSTDGLGVQYWVPNCASYGAASCALINASPTEPTYVHAPPFASSADQLYRISLSLRNTGSTAISIPLALQNSASPWEKAGGPIDDIESLSVAPGQWVSYEWMVRASETLPSVNANLLLPAKAAVVISRFTTTPMQEYSSAPPVSFASSISAFRSSNASNLSRESTCSAAGLGGPCLKLRPGTDRTILTSPSFTATANVPYRVQLRIYNPQSDDVQLKGSFLRNYGDYSSFGTLDGQDPLVAQAGKWTYLEWFALPTETVSPARVDVMIPPGLGVFVGDFNVSPVSLIRNDPTQFMQAGLNTSPTRVFDFACAKGVADCSGFLDLFGANRSTTFPAPIPIRSMGIYWKPNPL